MKLRFLSGKTRNLAQRFFSDAGLRRITVRCEAFDNLAGYGQ
jgi:hypothetical protein